MRELTAPLSAEAVRTLCCGDKVCLSGTILVARDAAHKRMVETLEKGARLPFDLEGQTIFYAGPAETPPGKVTGVIGPTTSGRMDRTTPFLLGRGVRGMIGKGKRSREVVDSIVQNGAVYFGATGGISNLLARCVRSVEIVAYPDLGTEAVRRLVVERMPLVVLIDREGKDLYERGPAQARAMMGL